MSLVPLNSRSNSASCEMESPQPPPEENYWSTLINPDKSPTPLLEQLCLGIAHVIATKFEPSNIGPDLTPTKLAAFYREAGRNYDTLFLETPYWSLSFIYQKLGCFHSLQPTSNAFEPPCIPSLLPIGFVRWETIQILLDPDEHHHLLQTALEKWDIMDAKGVAFPKVIPREVFPKVPDQDMVEWHEKLSKQLKHDHQAWNTPPRHSPDEPARDYFSYYHRSPLHRGSRVRRSRPSSVEDFRPPRRPRSPDDKRPRPFRFATDFDRFRRGSRSQNASPRSSPRSPSPPPKRGRSNTRRSRTGETFDRPSARLQRQDSYSSSSESSMDEDFVRPPPRRNSVDPRSRLSSRLYDEPRHRRHSHDETLDNERRSRPYFSNENAEKRSRRYRPSSLHFRERVFDDTSESTPSPKTADVPRFYVYVEPPPQEARRRSFGEEYIKPFRTKYRPRSSSNAGTYGPWPSTR
ncbi:hypothetical protein VTN49DRAFT_1942 [Thermomyces lanuginosus]|uniref:uncharacterized protein n=1 Tax=Thermomyces lanuginosus TaxID=5541 RepID=UPI0037436380